MDGSSSSSSSSSGSSSSSSSSSSVAVVFAAAAVVVAAAVVAVTVVAAIRLLLPLVHLNLQVVRFCQDYLVGRRIKHVQFGHVHKMEQRFAKDAPIAARFRLSLPAQADQSETQKYQPLPYIPPVAKRRLPVLTDRSRRKTK